MKRRIQQLELSIAERRYPVHPAENAFFRILCTSISFLLLMPVLHAQNSKSWLSGGGDPSNTRNAANETKISAANASQLAVKWMYTTDGDVSATPAVDGNAVYFPDWAGYLTKLDATTGTLIWKKAIKDYTGQSFSFARVTPAIAGNTLILGTQLGSFPFIGAHMLGVDKNTGALLWKTQVDAFPASIVTQSAVVQGNSVYVGVASQEEGFAADPSYPCCSFRGSMLSLDVNTGKINWKTYMTPNLPGYSGVAVWGSTPVIDVKRNSVYIATGNNYTVPQAALDCNAPGKTPAEVQACVMAVPGAADNHFDAIVSLDLKTGAIKWTRPGIPFDAWNVACFFGGGNCPDNAGPDYDFGQGPALFSVSSGSTKKELLGAGQKSGLYWALNPDDGSVVWKTQVGPGGTLGGLEWGSAVDGKRVYTAIANNDYTPHLMTKGPGAGTTVKGGFWSVLDAATGDVVWENAGSNPPGVPGFPPPPAGAVAINTGMVTVANGVMFAGALDEKGTMYAFDAATGAKLWSYESGGSVAAGPAVVNGVVYWGSGYSNFGLGTPNNKFYAFEVKGKNAMTTVNRGAPVEAESGTASIVFYPSPATSFIRVKTQDNSKIKAVRLYDLTGRLVKEVNPSGLSEYNLDVSAVQKGNYMMNVATPTMNKSVKVAVVH